MGKLMQEVLLQKNYLELGTPASEKSIVTAENALGLQFSKEYRKYLLDYGSVAFFGHDLTGISSFPGIDVVAVTKEAREDNPQIPKGFYAIEEAHIDGIIVWQDSSGKIYQTVPESAPVKIADSLKDYIGKC